MAIWTLKTKGSAEYRQEIVERYNISEAFAQILINKGIEQEYNEIRKNYPEPDASLLNDMDKGIDLLIDKIKNKKRIIVCGDMDVDGITATTICVTSLREVGADVIYDIPHRIQDGYGLNVRMVNEAIKNGCDTILTVDNGIAATDAITYAKDNGMTVIITDHHELPYTEENGEKIYTMPSADAIIDPKRPDGKYPFHEICGAVVAYKMMRILLDKMGKKKDEIVDRLTQIAAIATVCDVMDLVKENRTLVKNGLELLKTTQIQGLKALMEVSGIESEKLSIYHLGYVIGPMLNASGRLDTAKKGVELLLEQNYQKALMVAEELKELNDERKEMTECGVNLAKERLDEKDKVFVIYLPEVHESVVGIIAGRIKEAYHHPTIVLTDAENGGIKGSGRSIEQYNMFEELTKCKYLLAKFGGHPMAAGLSLEKENINILREELNKNTTLTEEDIEEKIMIDLNLPLHCVTEELIEEISTLEPYGKGNPKPVLAERKVKVRRADIIGKNRNTLKLKLITKNNQNIDALYFGDVQEFLNHYRKKFSEKDVDNMLNGFENNVELLFDFVPNVNEFRGNRTLQVIINHYY